MDDDFVPDYTLKCSVGQICTRNSHIVSDKNYVTISVNNKLTVWSIRQQDIVDVKTYKYNISTFADGVIGFENGIIRCSGSNEEDVSYRPHTRKVVGIGRIGNLIVSASADGSVILYDRIEERVKIWYKGNKMSISGLVCDNGRIFVICNDNSIKMWKIDEESLVLSHVFDTAILNVVVEGDIALVFLTDGKSVIYNTRSKVSKPWDTFKNLRNVKQLGNFIVIQTKKKIHTYTMEKEDQKDSKKDYKDGKKDYEDAREYQKSSKKDYEGAREHHESIKEYWENVNGDHKNSKKTYKDAREYQKNSNEDQDDADFPITLRHHETVAASPDYTNFAIDPNRNLVFLTKNNSLATFSFEFGYHKSQIIALETLSDKVLSLSGDSLIIWLRDGNELIKIGIVYVEGATCLCVLGDYAVIGTLLGAQVYNFLSYEMAIEISSDKIVDLCVSQLSGPEETLISESAAGGVHNAPSIRATGANSTEISDGLQKRMCGTEIYNDLQAKIQSMGLGSILVGAGNRVSSLANIDEPLILFEEPVVCICTSREYLAVSLMNSKIYLYGPSYDLKVTLYGHSLPARYITIREDKLLSCGADKLVKLWGVKYGECRKSFVGDTRNAEFVSSDLFVFGRNGIQYYKKHKKLTEFKCLHTQIVKLDKDHINEYMVSAGDYSISLFTMNEYEFIEESSSGEEELLREVDVANVKKYDEFLQGLEKLESIKTSEGIKVSEKKMDEAYGSFFCILERIDFGDMESYMNLLDSLSVGNVLDALSMHYMRDYVLSSRVFICLAKAHIEVCSHHPKYKEILDGLISGVRGLREQIALNESLVLIEKEGWVDLEGEF